MPHGVQFRIVLLDTGLATRNANHHAKVPGFAAYD